MSLTRTIAAALRLDAAIQMARKIADKNEDEETAKAPKKSTCLYVAGDGRVATGFCFTTETSDPPSLQGMFVGSLKDAARGLTAEVVGRGRKLHAWRAAQLARLRSSVGDAEQALKTDPEARFEVEVVAMSQLMSAFFSARSDGFDLGTGQPAPRCDNVSVFFTEEDGAWMVVTTRSDVRKHGSLDAGVHAELVVLLGEARALLDQYAPPVEALGLALATAEACLGELS